METLEIILRHMNLLKAKILDLENKRDRGGYVEVPFDYLISESEETYRQKLSAIQDCIKNFLIGVSEISSAPG